MIVTPKFNSLTVSNYGLFPGRDNSHNITIDFTSGLTIIMGVNGLGKTTLLNMLLRTLTGAYDLTGFGAPSSYEAILPEKPVRLRSANLEFFSQRVADGAEKATSKLEVSLGGKPVSIERRLDNLDLIRLVVDNREIALGKTRAETDLIYQDKIAELFNLSSFVDVLLILHNLIFFTERKAGALWDGNSFQLNAGVST